MHDEAELQEVFGAPPAKPTPSKLEPYKDKVADWFNQGINGTTIHKALVRNYGIDGSYSSVRRYLETLKNQSPKATVKLVFKPGESAQVDCGKGPDLADPETGKPFKTWFFVMTLAWSRHMYAEIVPDQKVATWLGFRIYLLGGDEIIHIASWHQVTDAETLKEDLKSVAARNSLKKAKEKSGV